MANRPYISKDGTLLCPETHEEIKQMDLSARPYADATERLLCGTCAKKMAARPKDMPLDLQTVSIRASSEFSTYIVTMAGMEKDPSSVSHSPNGIAITDFASCEVEHFIFDSQASGFAPRSITYIDDLKYLVTGDLSGRLIVWDMSVRPKALHLIQEEDGIRYTVYVKASTANRYLLLGVQNDVKVYKLQGPVPKFWTKLSGHSSVNHITYSPTTRCLYSCGWDDIIRVWSIEDFKLIKEYDADTLGIPTPMATLQYFDDDKSLAIETKKGLTILSLDDEPKTRHFHIKGRQGYGMTYLKSSKEFLIRVKNTEAWLVDRKKLAKTRDFLGELVSEEFPGHKYIANEDDSQILTNSNGESLLVYSRNDDILSISLSGYLTKSNGLEVLGNTGRIVVGDEEIGLILILKSEPKIIPKVEEEVQKEVVKTKNQKFIGRRNVKQEETNETDIPKIKRTSNMISKIAKPEIQVKQEPKYDETEQKKVPVKKGRPKKVQPPEEENKESPVDIKPEVKPKELPKKRTTRNSRDADFDLQFLTPVKQPAIKPEPVVKNIEIKVEAPANGESTEPTQPKRRGRKPNPAKSIEPKIEASPTPPVHHEISISRKEISDVIMESHNILSGKNSITQSISKALEGAATEKNENKETLPAKKPPGRKGRTKSVQVKEESTNNEQEIKPEPTHKEDIQPVSIDPAKPARRWGRPKKIVPVQQEPLEEEKVEPKATENGAGTETTQRNRRKVNQPQYNEHDPDELADKAEIEDEDEFVDDSKKSSRGRGRGRRGGFRGGKRGGRVGRKPKQASPDEEEAQNGESTSPPHNEKEKKQATEAQILANKPDEDETPHVRKSGRVKRVREYSDDIDIMEFEEYVTQPKVIATDAGVDQPAQPKRRGRKPKSATLVQEENEIQPETVAKIEEIEKIEKSSEDAKAPNGVDSPAKKKRGRPKRIVETDNGAEKEVAGGVKIEGEEKNDGENGAPQLNVLKRDAGDLMDKAQFYLKQMDTKHNFDKS